MTLKASPILKGARSLSRKVPARTTCCCALTGSRAQVHRHSARLPDARRRARAFQQKNVDARAIWDPYYSAALLQGGVRVLKDGTTLKQTGSFYLASRPYAEKRRVYSGRTGYLYAGRCPDPESASGEHRPAGKTMGLPEPVIASYLSHRPPTTIAPVDAHVAALQQQTADLFYQNRTVPKQVDIRERIWQPAGKEGAKS